MTLQSVPNEIVRALTTAILNALDPDLGEVGVPAARDVAQVLGLDGLDRALSVCRPGDPDTEPIARRLRALCGIAAAESSFEVFMTADRELGSLAVECGAVIEGEPGQSLEGTLSAREALEDLPLADDPSRAIAGRVRLTPQVSAALRAAVDWLCEGVTGTRGMRLRTEDSALELSFAHVNGAGLEAAAKVLAAVGGNLGPAATTGRSAGMASANGAWILRVPIAAGRETFLMVTQGDLDVALPWHAVLRLAMIPRGEFESTRESLGLPVLGPFAPSTGAPVTYPVVLLGHGLKRAYFVADQLIWRLPAAPVEAPHDPRIPGVTRAVSTEEGDVFHVPDLARLLEAVEPLEIRMPERLPIEPPATPTEPVTDAMAHTVPEAANSPLALAEAPAEEAEAALPELDPARLTPLPLRALVVEDSIAARLTLTHLLQDLAFEVHAVGSAAEFREAIASGPWALALIDTDLPDARGADFMSAVRTRVLNAGARMVALTRDGLDESIALEAGVTRSLRKPFDRGALVRVLNDLALGREDA